MQEILTVERLEGGCIWYFCLKNVMYHTQCNEHRFCYYIWCDFTHFTNCISILTNILMLFVINNFFHIGELCLLVHSWSVRGETGGGLDDSRDSELDTGLGTCQPLQIFILSVVELLSEGLSFQWHPCWYVYSHRLALLNRWQYVLGACKRRWAFQGKLSDMSAFMWNPIALHV